MTKVLKTTKTKDRDVTEAKLLEAAKEVFSQFGYNGATTRMIAEKSGVNVSLINRYFTGKYGLLMAMLKNQNIEFRETALPYPAKKTLVDEICSYADYIFDVYFADPHFLKIVMGQFCTDEKFLNEFRNMIPIDESHPEFLARIQKLVKTSCPIQEIASEVENVVFGFGMVNVIIGGYPHEKSKKSTTDMLARYAQSFVV